jgi:hypothetical protein
MLGPYDNYAINWGYRYLENAKTPEEEKSTLSSWINEKAGDPVYLFGGRNSFDPSSQTESVGDDAVKASTYGLKNLKIVAKNLNKWTATPDEGYEDLKELYGELVSVWSRYVGHVVTNVGGVYEQYFTTDQKGEVYTHIDKSEQVKAMKFLNEHVFESSDWLSPDDVVKNIGPSGSLEKVQRMQERQLGNLLRSERLVRMIENEELNGTKAYTLTQMLSDLRKGLWSELIGLKKLGANRRSIQRNHVIILGELLNDSDEKKSDINAAARAELKKIQTLAKSKANSYRDGLDQNHLNDIVAMVDEIFEGE